MNMSQGMDMSQGMQGMNSMNGMNGTHERFPMSQYMQSNNMVSNEKYAQQLMGHGAGQNEQTQPIQPQMNIMNSLSQMKNNNILI